MDLSSIFTNWKTSMLGAAAIASALADLLTAAGNGTVTSGNVKADLGIIFAGIIGLLAKDATKMAAPK